MNAGTRPDDRAVHTDLEPETHTRSVGRAIVLVVVMALLAGAGFAVGWSMRSTDEASTTSYVFGGSVVAGDELTDREQEMVEMTEQYVAAFIAQDGDAVASLMVPDGYLAMPTLGSKVVRSSDGSLQEWVEGLGRIPNELHDPIAVDGSQVVLTGRLEEAFDWMIILEFTDSGEVQIVSDTHWAEPQAGS
jgi:hypothetical protein